MTIDCYPKPPSDRPLTLGSLLVGITLLVALPVGQASAEQAPPNIVMIFVDDMGYGDIGPFGNKVNKTPNLDRMAAEGNVLRDFYVSNTACTPSRAALLTGTYAHRIGMDGVPGFSVVFPGDSRGLHPDEVTVAEMLKPLGYATGAIGKWHLGDQPQFMPLSQGFDEYFGIPYSNDMWPGNRNGNPVTGHGPYKPLAIVRGQRPVAHVADGADQARLAEAFTDQAIGFIERHQDQPFFLYLSHSHVHAPQFADANALEAADGNVMRATVEQVDQSVGRVLDKLVELGIDGRTLVIFTTDNGPAKGFSAGPLRGRKGGNKYEGHMRVPTITWWPSAIPAGVETTEIVATIDFLPSVAKLTGAALPKGRAIDGVDALDVLLGVPGAVSPHSELYYETQAIRQGKWKYLNIKGGELYNLENDLGETTNVAAAKPKIVRKLSAMLRRHNARVASNTRPAGFAKDARPILTDVGALPTLTEYMAAQ
ncbi:MAG: sulfatase [Planctomycetota bacterium]